MTLDKQLARNALHKWNIATHELANLFNTIYFDGDAEQYWVADEVGGCLSIADYFFNASDIVDFLKYDYSKKMMFEYYDYRLKCAEDKAEYTVCIRDYKKGIR